MPLYEYECQLCHRRTEKIQKFSDPELTVCPHCGGKLERTLTAPAVHFAGGGWYKDLYSSAKPPASGSGEAGAAKSDNSSSSGTSSEGAAGNAANKGSPAATPAAPSSTSAPAPSGTTAKS